MKIGIYLTFDGECAEAFEFYKQVFGGDFSWKATLGESPMKDKVPADQHDRIMHVSLPVENIQLMGSDYVEGMESSKFVKGTNKQICLSLNSMKDSDRYYAALSEGGEAEKPLEKMFWNSYWGCCTDKFGVRWMFDCPLDPSAKDKITEAVKELRGIVRTASTFADHLEEFNAEPTTKKPKLV